MKDDAQKANSVLARIPAEEYKRVQAQIEFVHLTFGQVRYRPDHAINYVYCSINYLILI